MGRGAFRLIRWTTKQFLMSMMIYVQKIDPKHSIILDKRCLIIINFLDPLRAKKTLIRKKLGHTAVSAIQALSVTL